MNEYEAKFLNIDPAAVEAKVMSLGGEKVFDRTFRRAVFDYADLRLDKQAAWVRVRDEGDRVTFAFKQRQGAEAAGTSGRDTGMVEEEVVVSDFETVCRMLRHIGLTDKFYQENRRVQFKLEGAEIDIEYWPLLEPHLEIEAGSLEEVKAVADRLGLSWADHKIYSTTQLYAEVGIDDKDYPILTFDKQVKRDA